MKVTLLGTGPSSGVPFIGCPCEVCQSKNPKNKRLRVSAYIELANLKLLIDTAPDLRQQALAHNITRVDAVLYTHEHADHTHGIDEMRSFNYLANDVLPIYGDARTISMLTSRFPYVFRPRADKGLPWMSASLVPHMIEAGPVAKFTIGDTAITAFEQTHGKIKSMGYRIGNFAYSTDVDYLSEEAFGALENLDVWVVDCLRYRPSPTHAHLERTLGWIERVKPKLAILTHMTHDIEYEKLSAELPSGVVPGYDGMEITL